MFEHHHICLLSPPLVDSVSNHVKPYWPTEATTASDSEDPGGAERLRVETKVNVELHPENKLNHIGERERETLQERDRQTPGNARDTATPSQPNSNSNHQPEQRKGKRGEYLKKKNWINSFVLSDLHYKLFVCLRYLKEQDQLPSSAERQKHEKPSSGEAERLQPPHHHLPSAQQQQHVLPASLLGQHHNPFITAALAGL